MKEEETINGPEVQLVETQLPQILPDITVTIPTGRLNQAGRVVQQVDEQITKEGLPISRMALLNIHGSPTQDEITAIFKGTRRSKDMPIFLMTNAVRHVLLNRISAILPHYIRVSNRYTRVSSDLVLNTYYGNARTGLMLPFSTIFSSQHETHADISMDDDLALGPVPFLNDMTLGQTGAPNEKMYVPRNYITNGHVLWKDIPLIGPYEDIRHGTIPERKHHAGTNTQNTALDKGEYAIFIEDVDPNSPAIRDNPSVAIAIGQKWNNPDVEAFNKLHRDILSGGTSGEVPLEAILTGQPEDIGFRVHRDNMDTAHMARYWAHPVIDSLPWLVSNPAISDKYGTMSRINPETGGSTTLGMRAEMWLLVGENGLLRQLSDSLGTPYIAAQTAAVFEHRRLGGSVRTPETVSTFSELLGLTLGDIVRDNIIIDPRTMKLSLRPRDPNEQIVGNEKIQEMYERMLGLIAVIDGTLDNLGNYQFGDPEAAQANILAIRHDITRRMRFDEGYDAFHAGIVGELNEQYDYQGDVIEVFPHLLRAGAQLRRQGQFPVLQVQ